MPGTLNYKSTFKKNIIYYFFTTLFLFSSAVRAQNDTIFFDKYWNREPNKEFAVYYRISEKEIKAEDALGYSVKKSSSTISFTLFSIKDYYAKNNQLQFQGYLTGQYNRNEYSAIGEAKWYSEDGKLIKSKNISPREYRKELIKPVKFPSDRNSFTKESVDLSPAFYISYSIAVKSQYTAGLEFCLDCQNDNKLLLGLGYGIMRYDDKTYGLPDFHLSYNLSEKWIFTKIGASHKNAYAIAGLTVVNLMDLGIGYSVPFNEESIPVIKGFTFGLTIRFTNNENLRLNFKY
ncbi:hypothetical protein ACHRV1_22910 [Flavobacterium aquidurense]|uniref:hypothetical protein n=1 Tax=Flavobacterium aquidurense TaxID=362413 RepID=UPI000924310B|nr:hypothetical protein [Flavobacterium aquidurense]OXA69967.1 hypothetical protein B0A67_16730 [Flavobacterium aquidurense]SHG09777.1 hypothetical protein SAMN05444481_102124 [Flavobacterium frigidimaris]